MAARLRDVLYIVRPEGFIRLNDKIIGNPGKTGPNRGNSRLKRFFEELLQK